MDTIDEFGNTLLHLTLKNKKLTQKEILDVFKNACGSGVDLEIKNKENETILHLAIKNRMKDVVDFLLKHKVNVDSAAEYTVKDEYSKWNNFLHQSGYINDDLHREIRNMETESASFIEWLISKGIDFDRKNERNQAIIVMAMELNLQHILPVLLKHTKDMNFVDEENNTLLHKFILRHYFGDYESTEETLHSKRYAAEIVKILLENGISADAENKSRRTPVRMAIEFDKDNDAALMLLERSTNIHHKNSDGQTLFCTVIEKWVMYINAKTDFYMKIARILISRGANVNEPDKYGKTPLAYAIAEHVLAAVEFLIDNGANVKSTSKDGKTMMHYRVKKHVDDESYKIIEMQMFDILVRNGCPLNAKDKAGVTPLHIAVGEGNKEMVRKLLEHDVDANCRDNRRETPLHYLKDKSCQIPIAELLMAHGANVNARNSKGFTVLHLIAIEIFKQSSWNSNIDRLQFLLEHNADINARTNAGHSVLHMALWRDYNRVKRKKYRVDLGRLPSYDTVLNDIIVFVRGEVETLVRHRIKLQLANLMNDTDNQYRNIVEKHIFYRKLCLKEIEELKSTFIDSKTSLLTLLQTNPNRRRPYINNEKFQELIHSPKLKKQFPEYATLILASYREVLTRQRLLVAARNAWLELTEISLPEECIEPILSFLSNEDLFVMTEEE